MPFSEAHHLFGPSTVRCHLAPQEGLDAPGHARNWTRSRLAVHAPDADEHQVADVLMVLDELVSNAVLHGGGCEQVAMTVDDGTVTVEVTDHSRDTAYARCPGQAGGGRGIHLVAAGSARWGQCINPNGKTLWAQLPLYHPVPAARAAS